MSCSVRFNWVIAAVLLLATAWKIAIPFENPGQLREDLVRFLEQNHFSVVATNEVTTGTLIIRATRASCQLQVARLTPDGSNRNLVRHLATGTDRSFVVFRGEVYAQQPIAWTVLHYLSSRFLRELGFVRHITPVIDVAESLGCNAERLPWATIQDRTA
ncbi:hypothetical protein [Bradyrhizobium sp. USDA 329]|uniref:hypothetical protein n=1 Tax=unclassified Bradyrhizobium TaxID=2631580 RepID=UPI003514BE47